MPVIIIAKDASTILLHLSSLKNAELNQQKSAMILVKIQETN
jgi:hypothetical protein